MTAPIDIHPDTLTSAGTQLTSQAQDMFTGLQGLQSTVTGSGNPWGGDEQGGIFASLYGVVLGHAMESIASQIDKVGYAGQGLQRQAQLMTSTEQGVTQNNTSMRDAIG